MKVRVEIENGRNVPVAVIYTDKITPEVSETVKLISNEKIFGGYTKDSVINVRENDIVRIYSENKKVFVGTENETLELHLRLYEAENLLDSERFIRISNSEIVNKTKIERFDISLGGTVGVYFRNGTKTYTSRRFVTKIKKYFGL